VNIKRLLICCFLTVSSFALAQNWIVTNAPNLAEDSGASHTNSADIIVSTHEQMVMKAHASATIGGRIIADYVVFPIAGSLSNGMTNWTNWISQNTSKTNAVNTNGMDVKEIYLASATNQIRLTARYYRGQIYEYNNSMLLNKKLDASGTNWASIFSSGDRTKLVVARDDGLIYYSGDSGITFRTISVPGKYEFTLSSTPKGSALVAVVAVGTVYDEKNSELVRKSVKDWYSVGVSANGDKLVVTSQSAPVLSIVNSDNIVVVSWSASLTNFVLQQNSDLTTTNWADVTNSVSGNVIDGQNEVTLPFTIGNDFFRLRSK
jgi:hypothetical protein